MNEPTHGEILRAIGVLEGQLGELLKAATDHSRERSSLGERVGKLETRMAQVVVLGALAVLLSPLIWNEVSDWLQRQPTPAHQYR